MIFWAHYCSDWCLCAAQKIVITAIVVKHLKFDVLSALKNVINDKRLAKGRVKIIIDCFSSSQKHVLFHIKIPFKGNLNIRIWFAENISVFQISSTNKQLNFLWGCIYHSSKFLSFLYEKTNAYKYKNILWICKTDVTI